jgi:large subunit ribosomal protein L9
MKVILLQNVPSLGRKFDIVNVKDGYAINFLLPKKWAKMATPQAIQEIERRKKKELIKREETKAFEKEIAEKIKTLSTITLQRKTSTKDHLFAAVTEKDIVEAVKVSLHVELDPHHIVMTEHIKTLGQHLIHIIVGEQKIPLTVVIEKSDDKK